MIFQSVGEVLESRICSNAFDIFAYIGSRGRRVSGILSIRNGRFCEMVDLDVVVTVVAGAKRWEIPVRVNFR